MALPVNISELVHGKVVEWERLEFKSGWNPEDILHTICAFANDINNWGGGYIVIGIACSDGVPQFPPLGLNQDSLDKIQGELIRICYQIQPNYYPISQPYVIDGQHILVIWVPAGDTRPYSCPSTQGDDGRRQYYIRLASQSKLATGLNQTRLLELSAKVPFDDRINQTSEINDLELGLIREFLQEVKSDLFEESANVPLSDLCRSMNIARGPNEALRPVNAGLLFFNKEPHRFFNRAWIEIAVHSDDSGRNYTSATFKGPLHKQIRDCLAYLQREVLISETMKISGKAESITVSNYPYNALEEVISNAVYHKSYAEEKPIEIQIFPDKIEILSYPGPLPPITNVELQQRRVVARDYRNRRIGDFLKELNLTEGKATGFPVIKDEMANNGSPAPVFYTDADKTLFLVTLPCHPSLIGNKKTGTKIGAKLSLDEIKDKLTHISDVEELNEILMYDITDGVSDIREHLRTKIGTKMGPKIIKLIDFLITPQRKTHMLERIGLTNRTDNYDRYIKPLLEMDWIERTIPEKKNSKNQLYRLTDKGKKLLKSK
jgi:ATP-dependent DNA helicase RecG